MQITLHGKAFHPFISSEVIAARVKELGILITEDYRDKNPLFLPVLNGSFIFAADLFREIAIPAGISFIKLASYCDMHSSGTVSTLIGLDCDISNRHIIVVEDIIDTGNTLNVLLPLLLQQKPASLKIVTLLLKPEALQHPVRPDYTGFEIPNRFVAGYGLDYNGLGRNLKEVYQMT